jgi:photosystem II stability/assembly factor-like uncharacterized protein
MRNLGGSRRRSLAPIALALALPALATAQARRAPSAELSGLSFRSIGPATTGGRIGEIAVDPSKPSTWYVAVHSGGVWKTTNAGITWSPIFDGQASYSIGTVTLDPTNPLTIWVGTGENNSQRSVGFGDGVYKSTDGGRNWTNTGLQASEHIGAIAVDPRQGDVVYVAATGPLWSAGGDRGVYRTADGGKTWVQALKPDNEWTGAQSLVLDPRNPDVIFASTHQRARRQWGFINGGPGSALYRSTDAGATWTKLTRGLPREELGKIGLAASPVAPYPLYALVEAANRAGGIYRSLDGGDNWERMSSWSSTSPMYYGKLYADPKRADRIYLMDTRLQVSDDGGRTVRSIQSRSVHVDHHALWIDPADTDHLILGNDGGLYRSFDGGGAWTFGGNLPITQFYKVDVDQAEPFYNVCGGTQDNNTLCGPSRTATDHGATNFDWFVVVGGDGFQPRIDPTDPNIIYAEWQHGELVRFDKRTGERIEIQPQAEPGDAPLRWHWDSPLIISPHAATRLYFGAQRLFRSDDRGGSWRPISGDLTRQLDRRQLRMMGRVWSVDAIARNTSTSFYGAIVSLSESRRQEGLLYAGTDDGLVQITEDGGTTWRAVATFPGVPDTSFVADLEASKHDASTVYAAFNHHKAGDYKPYVLKSADRGRTWSSIAGDLPERGPVWAIAQDHVDPNLLFAGTEFGVFATLDGGQRWIQLKGGLPTIAVRDLAIQEREVDLVLATFGRGFYVLDDYSPLRRAGTPLTAAARLLPVRDARAYVPASPLGGGPRGSQGDALWTAPNPEFGAVFTYQLRDTLKTRRARRQDAEKELAKRNADAPVPAWDSLRAEDREDPPAVVLTISDETGALVDRVSGPTAAGLHRVTWNLRHPPTNPITGAAPPPDDVFGGGPQGPLVVPGSYRVALALRVDGVETPIGEPQTFRVAPIGQSSLPAADRAQVTAFHRQTAALQRAALGAGQALGEVENRLRLLAQAIERTPRAAALTDGARALRERLRDLRTRFSGDQTVASRQEPTAATIAGRVGRIVGGTWASTSAPTATHRRSYEIASRELAAFLPDLRAAAADLQRLEQAAEAAGVPWTPGRIPSWTP